jgi:hypothetical protein
MVDLIRLRYGRSNSRSLPRAVGAVFTFACAVVVNSTCAPAVDKGTGWPFQPGNHQPAALDPITCRIEP